MRPTQERKVTMSIDVEPDQREDLRRLSKDSGVPMNVMIRKGIDMAIAYYEERESLLTEAIERTKEE